MSRPRVLVINPNSNESVTAGIRAALDEPGFSQAMAIDCVTLTDGPFGIETDDDIEAVVPLLKARIRDEMDRYDGFVIACYSDPGLEVCRAIAQKPVLGIQESAAGLCASYGRRFGVLALSRDSIQRHIARIRSIGLHEFHAGERPLDITVDQSANDPATLDRIVEAGRLLVSEDGAEMVILGCAGMVGHREPAQKALGVPVIDPVQAAATMFAQGLAG